MSPHRTPRRDTLTLHVTVARDADRTPAWDALWRHLLADEPDEADADDPPPDDSHSAPAAAPAPTGGDAA
jgi:hypothetical protein